MIGEVAVFDVNKGYGYIVADDESVPGSKNKFFVHFSAIQHPGVMQLEPGQKVNFTPGTGPRGLQASMVTKA